MASKERQCSAETALPEVSAGLLRATQGPILSRLLPDLAEAVSAICASLFENLNSLDL